MAVCIVESDEKKEPSIQYGTMYRLEPAAYGSSSGSAGGGGAGPGGGE
jgi:hypothetical protein